VKKLIIAAILGAAILAASLGGLALATDKDELADPISVSYGWVEPENPDAVPILLSSAEACAEVRLVSQSSYSWYEPSIITSDGDGHLMLIWDIGEGSAVGVFGPATRVAFFVNPNCAPVRAEHLRLTAVDAPSRDEDDWGQIYHIELLVGSDGMVKPQLITAEFTLRLDNNGNWTKVHPQAGIPYDLCPAGTDPYKPGNGEALECR
jgi:hypothetical protein